ncbi:MAG: CD1107 family mobile element protein, partial [Blautia faecis]
MAAAQDVSGNDAPACICDTKCSVETPNQECPVCKENADACKGQAAEPNYAALFLREEMHQGRSQYRVPRLRCRYGFVYRSPGRRTGSLYLHGSVPGG